MNIRQATLQAITEHGEILTFTTWLDVQPKLKKDAIITLKDFHDPKQKWVVKELYEIEHEATDFDFHRKWDNNNYAKHGGLDI